MLVVVNHLFICHVLLQSFQEDLFHDLDRHWGETDLACSFVRLPYFPFQKFWFFFSFPVSGNLSGMSNMMDTGLATCTASSLRTCVWVLSGPMDLCTFIFLKWSQTWFSQQRMDSKTWHLYRVGGRHCDFKGVVSAGDQNTCYLCPP